MKITTRQLRRIIRETLFMEGDPDYLSLDDVGVSSTTVSDDDEDEIEFSALPTSGAHLLALVASFLL